MMMETDDGQMAMAKAHTWAKNTSRVSGLGLWLWQAVCSLNTKTRILIQKLSFRYRNPSFLFKNLDFDPVTIISASKSQFSSKTPILQAVTKVSVRNYDFKEAKAKLQFRFRKQTFRQNWSFGRPKLKF